MCGLAGEYGFTDPASLDRVGWMLDKIAHRGPDGRGVAASSGATRGHVRIVLLDPSPASAQPFHRNGGLLTFNGEIWNWQDLRATLEREGQTFTTSGDTEVLAALLDARGTGNLDAVEGMFSFVWTGRDGRTVAVRDRFGKVPLCLQQIKGGFRWCSERRGLAGRSIPLPAGHLFDFHAGKFQKWYDLPTHSEPPTPTFVRDRLSEAVRLRLQADVPVCCLASGGLDSTAILALARQHAKEVVAYTAVYDPASEDLAAARQVCRECGIELREVPIRVDEQAIRDAVSAIEIPMKAQIEIAVACLPLARRIHADGFRACLSGEAADELFGGYGNFIIQASKADERGIVALRREQLAKMARGNFVRCNKAFMAGGVECRLPFMDRKLVESTVNAGKSDSPPGKVALKAALTELVPTWVSKRQKDTFQGSSGISAAVEKLVPSPIKFYNSLVRTAYGELTEG